MSIVGDHRFRTIEQKLDRRDLEGGDKLFEEKLSGKSAKDRPALNAMLDWCEKMMGALAEFERQIIRKRQAAAIAKAMARGLYKGRPRVVDDTKSKS